MKERERVGERMSVEQEKKEGKDGVNVCETRSMRVSESQEKTGRVIGREVIGRH